MPIDTRAGTSASRGGWSGINSGRGVAESAQTPADADTADVPAPSAPAPGNEDVTLETLIEPKLLVTVGQLRQALLDIGGEFAHRDHAVMSVSTSSEAESASSRALVNAPCPHFSSSRETLSAVDDVSTVTLLAFMNDLSVSAVGSDSRGRHKSR